MTLNIFRDNYIVSTDLPQMINTPNDFNGQIEVYFELLDANGGSSVYNLPLIIDAVNDPSFTSSPSDLISNGQPLRTSL